MKSLDYTEFVTIATTPLHENYIVPNVYWVILAREWGQDRLKEDSDLSAVDIEACAYGWFSYAQEFWDNIKGELAAVCAIAGAGQWRGPGRVAVLS
ncbi:MAG: hypothetical protein ACR2IK_19685 [Chloroflexota bacterium]